MIKKNLNNKKVIKALTIGLSLAMAGQPLTAMAAEENPTPDLDNNTMPTYKDVENGVADTAQEKADEAWVDIKTAEASAVVAVEEASGAGIDEEVKEAAQALGEGMAPHMEGNTVVDAPETDIEKAAGVLGVAEGFAEIAQSEAVEANKQAEITVTKAAEAVSLQTQAETVADNITTTVNEAQAFVDEKAEDLKSAGTEAEVKEVFETIETKVNATNEAVEKAASELSDIEKDFDKAANELDEATKEYNRLVKEANGIGANTSAFGDNKSAAGTEAAEAKARVNELAAKAEALKEAAEAAKEKYEGLEKVKKLEDAIVANLLDGNNKNNPTSGSDTIIEYFEAVVQYYYIPEIGGKFTSIEHVPLGGISNFWDDNSTSASTSGDILNYYTVKYEKDGEEHTIYLNYKLQESNKTLSARWQGIVIFEKTAHTVVDGHDIENLKDDGTGVLTYKERDKSVSRYVKEGDTYYKLNGSEKQELTVETQLRNDNWYSGNVLLVTRQDAKAGFKAGVDMEYKTDGHEKYDKNDMIFTDAQRQPMLNFRNALENSAALALKYANIAAKAQAAQTAFEKAEEDVAELQTLIGQVDIGETSVDEVATLQASLENAKSKLEAAKQVRDKMVSQLDELKAVRDSKLAALAPKVSAPTGGTESTADTSVAGGGVIINTLSETPGAPLAEAAGAAVTLNATGAAGTEAAGTAVDGGEEVETLSNIQVTNTALAAGLDEEKEPEITYVSEAKTPLFAPINEESMSWWWWLIVALLGATGYAMYKKHQEKKQNKIDK